VHFVGEFFDRVWCCALENLRIVVVQPFKPLIAIQWLNVLSHPATEIALPVSVDFDFGFRIQTFADSLRSSAKITCTPRKAPTFSERRNDIVFGGPNGAGKTTLMKILATLLEPDSGAAEMNGIDLIDAKAETKQILGYLPQDFGLYPALTAFQMLDILPGSKALRTKRNDTPWSRRCSTK
jgi:hypothetical protein